MSDYEYCTVCNEPTGAGGIGDGSIYCAVCETGPLCRRCAVLEYDAWCPSCAVGVIERLRTELNEAADATGIAGVDEPMSLLQCIQSLRAELEGYKSALIGHGWIITSVDVDKYGQIGTGGGASK